MKKIYSIVCLFFIIITLPLIAQTREEVFNMWKNPMPYLEAIRDGIKNREDTTWKADAKLGDQIRGLAYAINQEIIHAESKDWGNPSPARIQVIQKWGELLEPFTGELLALAMEERDDRYDSSTQARSILDFARPSEAFATEIRNYMSDANPLITIMAANLLYEHRLINEADKNILRQTFASLNSEAQKITFAQDTQKFGISDWNDLLIENAKMILKSKPKSNDPDDVINFYGSALTTAYLLKTKAQELSPLLDELVVYMEKNCPEYINHAKSARDSVLGLTASNLESELAANGSGPLLLKIGNLPQQKEQADQSRSDLSLVRPERRNPSAISKSSDVAAKEKAPWSSGNVVIVSFIAFLVVTFLAWLKLRKPKSIY